MPPVVQRHANSKKGMGNQSLPTLSSNCENGRACFCHTSVGLHAFGVFVPFRTVFMRSIRPRGQKRRETFAGDPNCQDCQGEGRGNKASVAQTGWNKREKNVRQHQKKFVCTHVVWNYFFNSSKSESDIVQQEKPETPCDWAGFVKERGLMRSSPSIPPSKNYVCDTSSKGLRDAHQNGTKMYEWMCQ